MKKNHYKKILTYASIILLISIAIAPSINASITKKSITVEKKEITGFGSIYGSTHYLLGWGVYELPFALVVAESEGITRQDRSNILSNYRINTLPLDKTYTVTASSNIIIEQQGKYYELVSESKTVTLTENEPNIEVNFALTTRQVESINVDKNKDDVKSYTPAEKPASLGSIYGNAGELYIWGFSPVRFAKITAGRKTTISGPLMGEYKIRGLPLGAYTITGSKKGYDTFTDTVTLTENNPDKQVFIDLRPNDKSVNAEVTQIKNVEEPACIEMNINCLFSSILISTNTRTNLFSTATFMP